MTLRFSHKDTSPAEADRWFQHFVYVRGGIAAIAAGSVAGLLFWTIT